MSIQTDAGRYINKISNRLRRQFGVAEELAGVTTAQGNLLSYILLEGKHNRIYQKDVEKEFDLRPSTATGLLRELEKKGFIRRISDEKDGRYKILQATGKAESIRKSLQEEIREKEAILTKGISPQDLEQFKRTAEKMLRNLEQREEES